MQDRWETKKLGASQVESTLRYHPCCIEFLTHSFQSLKRTVSGGQFDWGGRLLKSNGGAQRFPYLGRKSRCKRKGKRELDSETDKSSWDESRA